MNLIQASTITTSIITDKPGQTLEANEEIRYLITLVNEGESHGIVDIELPEITGISIQKIEALNLNTQQLTERTAGELIGKLSRVSIGPSETVQVRVTAAAKELKKEGTQVAYAKITGTNIYECATEKIINKINTTSIQQC